MATWHSSHSRVQAANESVLLELNAVKEHTLLLKNFSSHLCTATAERIGVHTRSSKCFSPDFLT
jgi:hypothetical protein